MKTKMTSLALAVSLCGCIAMAQSAQTPPDAPVGHEPPPQAYKDCAGRKAGETVQHATPEGKVTAICTNSPNGLVARPSRSAGVQPDVPPPQNAPARVQKPRSDAQRYSIEQAVSDQAQLHTIAFNGLAFITGDFGAATFIPPGKVCDFFGFQYMRDIDAAEKGHNPVFLNRVAGNVLHILNDGQRALIEKSARREATQLQALAEMRLPLIKALYRTLTGDIPAGSRGLNRDAVMRHVGRLFSFDAQLSYQRAQTFGQLAASLTPEQEAWLATMKFGDFNTWPDMDVEMYKLPRGADKLVNVAYMTHASEFFSWYGGSVEADTYFCPERHGTYFGGFYMKDMPAMGRRDYDISTSVTGDSGGEFLSVLTGDQRRHITAIPELQRKDLKEIIGLRHAIALELRKFLKGGRADLQKVSALGYRYGELDGEMSYDYATAFVKVNRTLTKEQRTALIKLRGLDGYAGAPAYIYSTPAPEGVKLPDTDRFFFPGAKSGGAAK